MAFVPSIGMQGLYSLIAPFAGKLIPNVPYKCTAIRALADIIAQGGDPKAEFYDANGLSDADYAADIAAQVVIVTLQHAGLDMLQVPSTYISGFPNMGGVPYTQLLLGVDLGAVPDAMDLEFLKDKVKDVVLESIGVAPEAHLVAASPTTIVSDVDHAAAQAARQAIVGEVRTDRAKFLEAQAQSVVLAEKVQELEGYIIQISNGTQAPPPPPPPPATPPTASGNLLTNPDFENGMTGWNLWGGSAMTVQDMGVGASYAAQAGPGDEGFGQIVPATPGLTYETTAAIRVTVAGELFRVAMSFMDAGFNAIDYVTAETSSTAYSSKTLVGVAPSNAVYVQVYVWKNAGNGFGQIDNVSLVSYMVVDTGQTEDNPDGLIRVSNRPNTLLESALADDGQKGWLEDGVWGPSGLTRGVYTGPSGTQYEQKIGLAPTLDDNQAIRGRVVWGWPAVEGDGVSEIKTYPSIVVGKKPGFANPWVTPGGLSIVRPNGTSPTGQPGEYPSGPTPGTFFPVLLNNTLPDVMTTFDYTHNKVPMGRGQMTFDLWIQNTPIQQHGFNYAKEIVNEIMIVTGYHGSYGAHGFRNPNWYSHDVTIGGVLWHVYCSKTADGRLTVNNPWFAWKFIVFQPHDPDSLQQFTMAGRTFNLKDFIVHCKNKLDSANVPWVAASDYLVSGEFGLEVQDGAGDVTLAARFWKP